MRACMRTVHLPISFNVSLLDVCKIPTHIKLQKDFIKFTVSYLHKFFAHKNPLKNFLSNFTGAGRISTLLDLVTEENCCFNLNFMTYLRVYPCRSSALGPVYTKRQCQRCDHSAMTLVILFSLNSMEILENGLQTHLE